MKEREGGRGNVFLCRSVFHKRREEKRRDGERAKWSSDVVCRCSLSASIMFCSQKRKRQDEPTDQPTPGNIKKKKRVARSHKSALERIPAKKKEDKY